MKENHRKQNNEVELIFSVLQNSFGMTQSIGISKEFVGIETFLCSKLFQWNFFFKIWILQNSYVFPPFQSGKLSRG